MLEVTDDDTTILTVWVVYERPLDYPEGFVVRGQRIGIGEVRPMAKALYAPSLDAARAALHALVPGLIHMPRDPDDEPQIVECWV